jgi:hypothetical protein
MRVKVKVEQQSIHDHDEFVKTILLFFSTPILCCGESIAHVNLFSFLFFFEHGAVTCARFLCKMFNY